MLRIFTNPKSRQTKPLSDAYTAPEPTSEAQPSGEIWCRVTTSQQNFEKALKKYKEIEKHVFTH